MLEEDDLCELDALIEEAIQYTLLPMRTEKLVMLNHLTLMREWIQKMKNKGL